MNVYPVIIAGSPRIGLRTLVEGATSATDVGVFSCVNLPSWARNEAAREVELVPASTPVTRQGWLMQMRCLDRRNDRAVQIAVDGGFDLWSIARRPDGYGYEPLFPGDAFDVAGDLLDGPMRA